MRDIPVGWPPTWKACCERTDTEAAALSPQPLKVKLWTQWVPFSIAAENHPFTDEQRLSLAGHEDHQTGGAWSAFGWRSLACMTCDVTVWTITAPEAS